MTNSLQTNSGTDVKEGITGSTLKIIAIICMLIDHTAAIILDDYIAANSIPRTSTVVTVDRIMRCIGRLAFPLFCFLLIEGFVHTHNKWKYAARLFLFALISEIPFDIANNNALLEFGYQNVFFTLCIGLVAIIFYEEIARRFQAKPQAILLLQTLTMIVCVLLANFLQTDYGGVGVLTIIIMYCFRYNRKKETLLGCIILLMVGFVEIFAFAIVPLVTRYNGKRGLQLKYVFYLFYPVHLLLLSFLSYWLGYR